MNRTMKPSINRKTLAIGLTAAMIISFSLTVIPSQRDPPLMAGAMTTSGDTYVAPHVDRNGNWLVQNSTIYDGTDVAVHGNIYVNGTTLTIRNCKLTIDEACQFQYGIESNAAGYIYFKNANLTVNPAGTTYPMVQIGYLNGTQGYGSHVSYSNSSLSWIYWRNCGSNNYMDNCSVVASRILDYGDTGHQSLNISSNHFKNFNETNLIRASSKYTRVSHNHFTNISPAWDTDNPGLVLLAAAGGSSGQDGRFMNITDNHFDYASSYPYLGLTGLNQSIVSGNRFNNITSKAAIYCTNDGGWTSIDNNTFEMICAANNTDARGIMAVTSTTYNWLIAYNDFWSILKNETFTNCGLGEAVGWGGKHAEIKYNHIGNITGDPTLATTMMYGIDISGMANSVNAFVNVSYNVIDNAINNVNCIVFENRNYGTIHNNTIHKCAWWSRGYGVYWVANSNRAGRWININDNVITDLHGDSSGIIVTHNATDCDVLRNRITVSNDGYPHEYEEGAIVVNGESWVTPPQQGASYTGNNCTIANNTIINNNAKLPDYQFGDCYHMSTGSYLRLIVNQTANIQYSNATFTLVVFGQLDMLTDSNTSITLSPTNHGGGYSVLLVNRTQMGGGDNDIDGMDSGWLNITVHSRRSTGTVGSLAVLILVFLALGVVIGAAVFMIHLSRSEDHNGRKRNSH